MKAVIPAAGWGMRFLPATKAVPKEMLPLIDRPLIQYAVEEAASCGIRQIILVTARGKGAIEEHFGRLPKLEQMLGQKGEYRLLEEARRLSTIAEITYTYQNEQLGLGHAILTAHGLVGDEPFAVLLPDDFIDSEVPAMGQILEVFRRHGSSVIAVERVSKERVRDYGIIEAKEVERGVYRVLSLVEKPKPGDAHSDLGIVGRYVLTPGIFEALQHTPPGKGGEIQLTDGLGLLLKEEPIYACEFDGIRHDVGTPLGLIKASVALALKRPEIGDELRDYLKGL